MKAPLKEADLCGTLMQPCDDYFLNNYTSKSCKTMILYHLDATGYEKPWTEVLKGKKAVHIGGGMQIMFGIRGKRWDENPMTTSMYNDAWVYPSEDETPKGADMVEDACYWR